MMTLSATKVLVTIQLVDDHGNDLIYALALVTSLFALLASVGRFGIYVAGWVEDITEALVFTAKVFDIALVSLAYGMGVRL